MLPRTAHLLTILSFLMKLEMEMTVSSPVYNLQPAYITATIGSTGRNIRNLPCISRKSNQSGVCMFAIDCLKANGTHLGTCIDRFYFGSCCHIAPLEEITENTIDAALIPSREPPHRITTQTTTTHPTTTTPNTSPSIIVKEGFQQTIPPTPATPSALTTLITKSTKPAKPIKDQDSESYKITTFQTVDDVPVITTIRPLPSKTKGTPKPRPVQTTFGSGTKVTKVTKPPLRPQTTPKPITSYININRNTTQNLNGTRPSTTFYKPSTTRVRPKPTKPVRITKPLQNSTVTAGATTENATPTGTPIGTSTPIGTATPSGSPSNFSSYTTPMPIVQKTTVKSTETRVTKPPKKPTVTKGTESTTKRPTTQLPSSTTTSKLTTTTTTTTKLTTIKTNPTTVSTTESTLSTTLSNEVLVNVAVNASKFDDVVSGNPVTNEIEAPKPEVTTSGPSLVTWSEIKNESNTEKISGTTSTSTTTTTTTVKPSTSSTTEKVTRPFNENPDDWVPVTDNWVQLPSLTTPDPESLITSTEKSESSSVAINTEVNRPSVETSSVSTEASSVSSVSTASGPIKVSSSTENVDVSGVPSSTSSILSTSSISSSPSGSTEELPVVETTTLPAVATSGLNMSDFTDVCGRRMVPEGRIVGGEKSAFGKWPWQISLRQWRTSTYLHKCGAALLNENWAITAAHCVDNVPPSDLLLRLGEHDLSTEAEPYLHQERRVQIVASHPQFDPRTFEYDLALLRFYEPVTFQPNIIPVCVPQNDENFVGRNAFVTGWGRLYEDGPLPSVLQEVSVPVINNTVCESMYRSAGYIEHIPNIFICAGWRRGGFDSCEGDSGGPMVIQRQADKRFVLAGVISWGIGCAEPNQPGVYTRISEFRDWINQILQF